MTSLNKDFLVPAPVLFVIERLKKAGFHAYCVGGCVRDHLMGRAPGDYDVTTSARPEDMMQVFGDCRLVETGLQHGTVTVVREGMNIEVTTYRIDGSYEDGRHPDSVTFTDRLSDDLCRRDFTINAMAFSPEEGIVDLFSGQKDLENKIIRCVGVAADRFSEDGLRILRALRFASVLDFTPDEECAAALIQLRYLLDKISRERIYVELTKLLGGKGAVRILRQFPSVIARVLPGLGEEDVIKAARALERDRAYMEAEGASAEASLGYALLLASLNKEEADAAISSLKPSRAEKNAVLSYRKPLPEKDALSVAYCMRCGGDESPAALARYAHAAGKLDLDSAREIGRLAEKIAEEDRPRRLSMLPLSGNDLVALGYKGKEIGDKLEEILDRVMKDQLPCERECLIRYLQEEKA